MNKNEKEIYKVLKDAYAQCNVKIDKAFRRYFYIIKKIKTYSKIGNEILDIGCGPGIFSLALLKLGYKVTSVDIFEDGENKFEKLGIVYKRCNIELEDLPFNQESFDLIVMLEVIEHFITSPLDVLVKIKCVLRSSGYIFITTPNVASLNNRFRLLRGKNIFWGLDKYYFTNSINVRHNREYTKSELKYLLNKTGFKVKEVKCYASHKPIFGFADFISTKAGCLRDIIPTWRKWILG